MAAPMIYLGTTSADLHRVRQQATALLDATGYLLCDAMPLTASSPEPFESGVRHQLSSCTGMVLLVGTSHGPLAPGEVSGGPVSRTQVEHRVARELGISCHAFVLHEDFPTDFEAALAHPETPAQQAAQFHFRLQLQAQPRGCEFIESPDRLASRLRMLGFRLEELREDASSASSNAVAASSTTASLPEQHVASPPVPSHDTAVAAPGAPPTWASQHQPHSPPAQRRGLGVVISSIVGIGCLLLAAGVLGWSQLQRSLAPATAAPAPATTVETDTRESRSAPEPQPPKEVSLAATEPSASPPTSKPAPAPKPHLPPALPPRAPEQSQPARDSAVPVTQLTPIGAPSNPDPPLPVKATIAPLTAEARAQLALARRQVMRLADLQATLFFTYEPLTLLEKRQVSMQRLAEQERTTVKELETRFSEYASGPASAPQAAPLDRALGAFLRKDYRGAIFAAGEAAQEPSAEPDELCARLLLLAHMHYFDKNPKAAFAFYERVMKTTTSTGQPAEWALSTSMVAMLSDFTINEYKPAELMMRVLANEERHHGKESYAVARTLRQIAYHLPTTDDLEELRETVLGRASKIHEKLDPERATPEMARIYIAFAKGRSSIPASESRTREPRPAITSKKPRKTGFRNDAYYAGALKIDERHFGLDSPAVADDLMEQGRDFTVARRFEEAEPPLRRALAILNKQKGSKDQQTIDAQAHLGRLLRESGRLAEAETVQLSALANQKECPEESDFCLGLRHYELALTYKAAGRAQSYEETLRDGIAMAKGAKWPDVFPLHMMLEDLVRLLEENRRDVEAVPYIVRRVDVMDGIGLISPDEIALWLGKAANTLSNASDENPRADVLFQRALKAGAELPTPLATVHVVNLRRYADYLIPLKRIKEAEKYLREAVTLDEQVPPHEEKGSAALLLGSVLMSHGDPKEAITHLKAALPVVIQRDGELHPDALWGYYCLCTSYLMADRPKDAEPLLRKTIALMDRATEKDAVIYASTVLAHGMSLMDLNRLDDAEPVLRRSVKLEYAARQEEGDSGSETAANYYRDVLTAIYGLTEEEAEERILDIRTGKSVPRLEIRKPTKVPRPKLTA